MPRQYTPRVALSCERCETAFTVNASRAQRARFCSSACQYNPSVAMVCVSCGKLFEVPAARSSKARFCSTDCKKVGTRIPIAERLLKSSTRSSFGCLLWTGMILEGYGQITASGERFGTHVAAYREWVGPIPEGHQVHHLCDVNYAPGDITYRRCIEPTHLTTGTPKQNSEHMVDAGRSASGDRSSSRLHPESRPRGDAHPSRRRSQGLSA
jgi:hypothetical protein